MSVFEYIFSLYSLLLGLALAHLLSGLAKVVEARERVRLGWPTALLALQMMLTLAIFWEIAWRARNAVPDNSAALFASLIICGLLYFGAVLVIPSDATDRERSGRAFLQGKRDGPRLHLHCKSCCLWLALCPDGSCVIRIFQLG